MGKNILKILVVALVLIGVLISISNFVPKAYAAKWVWGTLYYNTCVPSDRCWMGTGLCCILEDPSNCCYTI